MFSKVMILLALCAAAASAADSTVTGRSEWDFANGHSVSSMIQQDESYTIETRTQKPVINALFSLAVPGAGQFRSERYTKAAIFIAAEAALIVYAIVNDKKGDDKTREYQQYADLHWSPLRYAYWINTHGVTDYRPNISFTQADFDAIVNAKDFSKINEWERGPHRSGISHTLPPYGDQQYYELIGKYHQFKYGWDTYPQNSGIPVSDQGIVDALVPQQLKDYAAERGKANDYYYAASFAASALVINHIVSAVDGYLSTFAYNREISASVGVKQIDAAEGKRLMSELRISVGL
ncbi:MAG: hypothetical protein ACYC09_05860 [Bacteroidota bacterium]